MNGDHIVRIATDIRDELQKPIPDKPKVVQLFKDLLTEIMEVIAKLPDSTSLH